MSLARGARPSAFVRGFAADMNEKEASIHKKLMDALAPAEVSVMDTSGGCGTMYDVKITSDQFAGKTIIKQHKMVTEVLQEDIPQWHGFVLKTKAPKKDERAAYARGMAVSGGDR
eukprot:CAMPEP_0182891854 /NCGR_PEP_ID=MMETSP0034_2-20130328/23513_1 /TAXON_ID=156128 /ORGANISM="Nephroselmis pyriformis, Strain CCMP717" /LENGTH=114 /DNA_ID=CAMNT_0025025489 /DNA_START=205 /DNA_END=547 /DNA_ORIENTATION=-